MRAGVAELKARLSHYLDRVRAGQEVVVTDRGRPVAKLIPIGRREAKESRRERLLRDGLLIGGHGRVRRSLREPPEGDTRLGQGVLAALIDERRQGR
jgi:prevent-host-death family protein